MNGFDWFGWVLLPLMVFFARVVDVTLGTLRIIFISRGRKYLAPLLGFVEVFIWVAVIAQITRGTHNIVAYLAYAAGFAAGNFIGMWLEDRLALGTFVLRVIISDDGEILAQKIHAAGFGVTRIDGQGAAGPVKLIYIIVKRRNVHQVLLIIHETAPNAFVSIEEVRSTEKGIFPASMGQQNAAIFGRKSK